MAALSAPVLAAVAGSASAQLFLDDFDGSFNADDAIENFTNSDRIFTPDLNSNTGFGGNRAPTFGSNFDLFGIANNNGGLPFDVIDSSAGVSFPQDRIGIIESTKTDNFVLLVDTANGNNATGFTTIEWTIDVSSAAGQAIDFSVDVAAIGDFEASDPSAFPAPALNDYFAFDYEVKDGGGATIASGNFAEFYLDQTQDDADVLYEIDLESDGTNPGSFDTSDFYFDPFYESAYRDVLVANGPGTYDIDTDNADMDDDPLTGADDFNVQLAYHSLDDGTGDDPVAQDGLIPVPLLSDGTNQSAAYEEGGFDTTAIEAYKDPIYAYINGVSGPQLDDDFLTVTNDALTLGNDAVELVLTFTGRTNDSAGQEIFVFDDVMLDILASIIPGDFNDDGFVTIADIDGFLAAIAAGMSANQLQLDLGDFTGDDLVSIADIDGFLAALAGPLSAEDLAKFEAAGFAIPEPATLALLGLGVTVLGLRHRK
ncbi:MAG: PEP-CTERM sorting domain-containing protein [Planctomycetota bacterium]